MWLLIYSFLIGGGAARLAETRPLTEERVVRPPPCVRDPTTSFTFTRASKIINLAAEGQRGPAKPRSAASTAAAGAGDATEWPACVTSGAVDVRLTSIMNGAMRGSFH